MPALEVGFPPTADAPETAPAAPAPAVVGIIYPPPEVRSILVSYLQLAALVFETDARNTFLGYY